MSVSGFIQSVKEYLSLKDFEKSSKKKSVKSLLKKLRTKRKELKKTLAITIEKKQKKALEEELEIVALQIKKGKNILHELDAKE